MHRLQLSLNTGRLNNIDPWRWHNGEGTWENEFLLDVALNCRVFIDVTNDQITLKFEVKQRKYNDLPYDLSKRREPVARNDSALYNKHSIHHATPAVKSPISYTTNVLGNISVIVWNC
jgi:hypothetical protein